MDHVKPLLVCDARTGAHHWATLTLGALPSWRVDCGARAVYIPAVRGERASAAARRIEGALWPVRSGVAK